MRVLLWILFCMTIRVLQAQNLPPKQAYPYRVKQIHSGHSLTDPLFYPHWPGQYVNLISNVTGIVSWQIMNTIGKSTVPGSTIKYRWDNRISTGEPDARHNIENWEVLSITERVPLAVEGGSNQSWYLARIQEQKTFLSKFVEQAWRFGDGGRGAAVLLWTTWTNIDDSDGPFRAMLDIQGKEWEAMQDYANENRPSGAQPVYIIPGHRMMARIYDDIEKGIVPGITNIKQLFSDNIHTNELGAYAIAMIHYACMYNKSPIGLPNQLIPNPPANTLIPTPEFAGYVQQMVWDVVTSYPRTGIQQSSTTCVEIMPTFDIQQYDNQVYIEGIDNDVVQIDIYDILGTLKYRSMLHHDSFINLEFLPNGLYVIQTNGMNRQVKNTVLIQLVGK